LLLITAVATGLRFYCIDRLPPGLHYDEAFNNLLALRLPHWDPFPVFFFDVEFGRCVLHPYLIALLFQATGPIVLGGRLVSAVAGTLTVPLLFFLSRVGMEYIMVPTLAVPAFGAIWRALHRQRFWDAVAAGVILGLTPYTYPPALFVPLFLALFFGCRAIFERGFLRANWRILAIVTCVALLVVAPMAHFFVTHPHWLTLRAGQVVRGDRLEGISKTMRGIFTQGDLNPRQNLPGRPALDPIQAALFILGVGTCLARRRPPYLFLLCWMVVMSLPSVLTEYPPHFGRMLGAAPAAAVLVGLGTVTFYDLILRAATRLLPQARRIVSMGVGLLLIFAFTLSGVRTARDYFLAWGQSDDLFIAFDVGLRWIGEYVAALPQEECQPSRPHSPTVAWSKNCTWGTLLTRSFTARRLAAQPKSA
jgi:hypothetical protein